MIENINWYPGHMKKTRELIVENLKMVDVVVEVVDGRIPLSSRNPILSELTANKNRIIVLTKCDLADDSKTILWQEYFAKQNITCIKVNAVSGGGSDKLLKTLEKIEEQKNAALNEEGKKTGRIPVKKPLRLMIVGVPNVGKSSLINRLTGHKSAKTGDRPGVTRGKQWLSLENGMQLLDTPGILWPKFDDRSIGLNLAFCGSIKDEILDTGSLALELIKSLTELYPNYLRERYKLKDEDFVTEYDELIEPLSDPLVTMEAIARNRGFVLKGKKIDYDRCATIVLDEFRGGLIGKISLEIPTMD